MMFLRRLVLFGFVLGIGGDIFAATCVVDTSGTFSGAYATIDDALHPSACGGRGSIIDVYCPSSGCLYGSTTVSNRRNILIRSMEVTGVAGAGPVSLTSTYASYAVRIRRSRGITFRGFHSYTANMIVVDIDDSAANIVGQPSATSPRYSTIGGLVGIDVSGRSLVNLHAVGLVGNNLGMRIHSIGKRHPAVHSTGMAFLNNQKVVQMDGGASTCPAGSGPVLEVVGDGGPVWLNYAFGNVEGFEMTGSSRLAMDHTILAGNLRTLTSSGMEPRLFELQDASSFDARNVLIYDNDAIVNPGTSTPWSEAPFGAVNTDGRILHHETCDEVVIEASTVADNQCDTIFHLNYASGAGSGMLTLDHVIVAHSWAKVLSESSFGAAGLCAPVNGVGAYFWDNRVDADPTTCMPASIGTSWSPGLVAAGAPGSLSGYPAIPTAFTSLYLMTAPFEPISPYPQPTGLYTGRQWTVDGTTPDNDAALDVGYHDPS